MSLLNPKDFVITRKRKLYKFALFHNSPLCFEVEDWRRAPLMPTVIEIGAGTGLFSVHLAETGTRQVVAADVKADRLQTGARRAAQKSLKNVYFLRARVDQLPELIKEHSIESLWVTFPDPYPKARHAKHRLLHPHYLSVYAQLLKANGALCFKTDARKLFEWSLEQLVAEGWRIEELSFDLHESNLSDIYKIKTTYEMRYMSEGLPINFVKATPPVR